MRPGRKKLCKRRLYGLKKAIFRQYFNDLNKKEQKSVHSIHFAMTKKVVQ